MSEKPIGERPNDGIWYWYLTGIATPWMNKRQMFKYNVGVVWHKILPGAPRCTECYVPLSGVGRMIMKPFGYGPASYSPRLCNTCERFIRKSEGGAEVELSMLFADVRGSTSLAESLSTLEYQRLIQRFYKVTTDILVRHNALVNRLMGDQVIGLFVPRIAGKEHARVAIHSAEELLRATGHGDAEGPWIPVGAGVHTGVAYVGTVGTNDGVNEIAVLGSAANLAARLSSQAGDGEVLVSEEAAQAAGLTAEGWENKSLEMKGISQPVQVRMHRVREGAGQPG